MATMSMDVRHPAIPISGAKEAKEPGNSTSRNLIAESLKPFLIGEKLRTLRLKKKLGLVELGKHTGFSAAMLSKLERGKLYPTLPTLVRIATVFNVGLDYFFTDERKRHVVEVVRKQNRQRFPERPGTSEVSYFFESLDYPAIPRKLSSYYAEFQTVAREKLKPHSHAGVELLYLISGSLVLTIGSDAHTLHSGDSIYFDSAVPHTYWKSEMGACTALIVTTA
jgi:transcriptional regulator with XRE-family HTH domain